MCICVPEGYRRVQPSSIYAVPSEVQFFVWLSSCRLPMLLTVGVPRVAEKEMVASSELSGWGLTPGLVTWSPFYLLTCQL